MITMRTLLITVALLLASSSLAAQSVLCESIDGYRECRVGSSGRVRLVYESSNRACFEDLTWGTASSGVVWVSRGCRAAFKVEVATRSSDIGGARAVCESLSGELELCPADGNRGVALAQQLSTAPCVKDKSWGYSTERGQIWVDHGCRAEFLLGKLIGAPLPSEPLNAPLVCESADVERRECAADTTAGVQIVRELGGKPCAFGRDWGYEQREKKIWVAGGCRAEFVVRGKPTLPTVVCESQNNASRHCPADTALGVALVKMLGEKQCALGTTWGFDDEGVWVNGGCRAQFALGGFRLPESAVPKTAARIVCESDLGTRNQCAVDTARGVGLVAQRSASPCVLNRSWGYDKEGIWVSDGCGAEFAVAR